MAKEAIIEIKNLCKKFKGAEGKELVAVENINLTMHEGEIIALLGKSGSGKSTLLRIIAGLTKATSGEVDYRGNIINKPALGIAMVFQNFALLPWLTVLQNVELGLEAQGIDTKSRLKKALKAIDMIGLDGFESAYPKELSGGMQQRVGMARALVVNPDVLLMDEPFSSLDVLTTENLRRDLIDLWDNNKIRTKSIFFVTHNIVEAALISDRIIIFSGSPGTIRADLKVSMPRPRHPEDPKFRKLVDDIYTIMTGKTPVAPHIRGKAAEIGIDHSLPDAGVNELTGLLDAIISTPEPHNKMDLPELADLLHFEVDSLFPLTEALELLHFATVSQGDIELTEAGKKFAEADILQRKKLFATQLATYVPLAQYISECLLKSYDHKVSENVFIETLEKTLNTDEAERILKVIIDWGRYAEIFAYDYDSGILSWENPK